VHPTNCTSKQPLSLTHPRSKGLNCCKHQLSLTHPRSNNSSAHPDQTSAPNPTSPHPRALFGPTCVRRPTPLHVALSFPQTRSASLPLLPIRSPPSLRSRPFPFLPMAALLASLSLPRPSERGSSHGRRPSVPRYVFHLCSFCLAPQSPTASHLPSTAGTARDRTCTARAVAATRRGRCALWR
jgi:hypothetical protein